MKDVIRELKLLKNEDFIWLIYFFIVIFALISNNEERKYLLNDDKNGSKNANLINTTILIVAFFIYLYFVIVSFDNLNELKKVSNKKDVRVAFERLISSLIFLVGGAYSIYADYDDKTTDIDLAIF